MSRFFKSAAFPILIVVVLAFFVQKLVSPHNSEPVPSYGDFITQLDAGQVKTVDVKTKDNTIVVKPRTGAQYERGFLPDNAPLARVAAGEGQGRATSSTTTTSRARRATAGCRC